MLVFENISRAISGLWANKMRALLTMLGIIIGIGSVIGIVSVGQSMTNGISESMREMGVGNITVSIEEKSDENRQGNGNYFIFGRSQPRREDLISDDMIAEYRRAYGDYISHIYRTESVGSGRAQYSLTEEQINAVGAGSEYAAANGLNILTGRFLKEDDERRQRKVCVVSSDLCSRLMPGEDPIGKELDLTINGRLYVFYIVGVYESDSTSRTQTVYMPLSTAKRISGADDGYQSITVVPAASTDTQQFTDATERFFASLYSANKNYTASASNMESMVESVTDMMTNVSLAIAVIAGISLLVGGIGVMNIMLVSITERTREIGTRKALGATNGTIMMQFITESVIICAIGGLMGVGVGLIIGNVGANLLGYSAAVSLPTIMAAVRFSMAIGVFFGFYPADKAARLNPIDALRYE